MPVLPAESIKREVVRKSIHASGIIVVILVNINYFLTFFALVTVTLLYIISEALRLKQIKLPIFHNLIRFAARGDVTKQVAGGPLTLSLGILLTLALFPYQIASFAIIALTLGDGVAALIGRIYGRVRPYFLLGKSIEGSLACFGVVFTASFMLAHYYQLAGSLVLALGIALTATMVEVLPLKTYDNLAIPIFVACFVTLTLA